MLLFRRAIAAAPIDELPKSAKSVAAHLANHMDRNGRGACPSVTTLRHETGYSETEIRQRALPRLVAGGWVIRHARRGLPSVYDANLARLQPLPHWHPTPAAVAPHPCRSGTPTPATVAPEVEVVLKDLGDDVAREVDRLTATFGPRTAAQRQRWIRAFADDANGFRRCVAHAASTGDRPAALLDQLVKDGEHRRRQEKPPAKEVSRDEGPDFSQYTRA